MILESTTTTAPRRHLRFVLPLILIVIVAALGWLGYRWYMTGSVGPIPVTIAFVGPHITTTPVSPAAIARYSTSNDASIRYASSGALGLSKARVYAASITSQGFIALPKNSHDLSWYNKSGLPGGGGLIILTGYGTKTGALSGVGGLISGDNITLTSEAGTDYTYSVTSVDSYSVTDFNQKVSKLLGAQVTAGTETLNILAYSGTWVPQYHLYNHLTLIRSTLTN